MWQTDNLWRRLRMLFQTSIPWLSERPVLASMALHIRSVARYSSQPVAFLARNPESEAKEKNSGTISELAQVVSERSHCSSSIVYWNLVASGFALKKSLGITDLNWTDKRHHSSESYQTNCMVAVAIRTCWRLQTSRQQPLRLEVPSQQMFWWKMELLTVAWHRQFARRFFSKIPVPAIGGCVVRRACGRNKSLSQGSAFCRLSRTLLGWPIRQKSSVCNFCNSVHAFTAHGKKKNLVP